MSATSPSRPSMSNDRRTNSLVSGFIKRTRSSDLLGDRKTSNNGSRSKPQEAAYDAQITTSPVQASAPKLPSFNPQPQLQTFGGDNYRPKMADSRSPSVHASVTSASYTPSVDITSSVNVTHERTQSMTNRGRYSYATSVVSSINSPRRMRRRKDPTPYNVLIIGARNCGKTDFLNFLKSSIAPLPEQQNVRNPELDTPPPSAKVNPGSFVQHYQEVDLEGERVGLTIWDSKGFDKNLVDYQLREVNNFVESKFEDTFIEQMKVVRSPGFRDTHIHCVFFLFDPAQLDMNINAARKQPSEFTGSFRRPHRIVGALDEDFELQILKSLQGKTTVIPVISKADTVTAAHMAYLKKMVGESFQQAGLDPLEALHFEGYDSEEEALDEADENAEEPKLGQIPEVQPEEKAEEMLSDAVVAQEPAAVDTLVEKATGEATAAPITETAAVPSDINGGEIAAPVVTQANIKRSLTHKRESSKLSVSTVMFDNGYMPMSILSPDDHSLTGLYGPIGRKFVWGFADPYNPEHCDFVKLKETCFTEWRADFRDASSIKFYERWRTGRLNRGPTNGVSTVTTAKSPTAVRKPSGGIPIDLIARKKYAV